MKHYTAAELKAEFLRLGYHWSNTQFMLVSIRAKNGTPNKFDDLIGFVYKGEVYWGTGTTEPGTYWLEHPGKVNGTAVLKPGQYVDTWAIGYHKGQYKAFCQAKPVTVYRDNDKDAIAEATAETESGLFSINWHRANEKAVSLNVEKWSAGCQVCNDNDHYRRAIAMGEESKQEFFTGTLLIEF